MEGGDDALADKPYARSIPFDKHASGSDKETLDRHARSIDEQSRRASILC